MYENNLRKSLSYLFHQATLDLQLVQESLAVLEFP